MKSIRKIKSENNKLSAELKNNHEDLINNILCFVRADLNSVHSEFCINEILNDLKDKLDSGKEIEQISGDYRNFLLPYVKRYKKSKAYKLLSLLFDYLPIGIYGVCLCVLFDIVYVALSGQDRVFENMISINYVLRPSIYICALLIFMLAILCIKNISKSMIISKDKGKAIFINLVSFLIIGGALGFLAYALNSRGLFNILTFTVKKAFMAIALVMFIVFVINMIVSIRYKKK